MFETEEEWQKKMKAYPHHSTLDPSLSSIHSTVGLTTVNIQYRYLIRNLLKLSVRIKGNEKYLRRICHFILCYLLDMWCEEICSLYCKHCLLDKWIFIHRHKILYMYMYDFMLSYDVEKRPLFSVETIIAILY